MNRRRFPLFVALLLAGCPDDGSGPADGGGSTGAAETGGSTMAEASTGAETGSVDASTGAATSSGPATSETGAGVCEDEHPAIVTDIDETLTVSDQEFLMQLGDGTYDPLEREGGAAMINGYADLGYRVLYLTARAESLMLEGTNETAREATQRWLEEHGYPTDEANTELVLSADVVFGDAAQMYKAGALMDRQAEGWRFDYAYGNATSDIGAYEDAAIGKDVTFIIGVEAGAMGTVAVEGEDWLAHTAEHLPTVPAVCEG